MSEAKDKFYEVYNERNNSCTVEWKYVKELEEKSDLLVDMYVAAQKQIAALKDNKQLILRALIVTVDKHKRTYGNITGFDSGIIEIIEIMTKKSIEEVLNGKS